MRTRHAIGTLGAAGALLVSLLAGVSAPAVAAAPAIRGAYRPDAVLVGFLPGTSAAARSDARRAVGAVSHRTVSPLANDVELFTLPSHADVARAIAALEARPGVRYAEPDYLVRLDATSDDPCYLATSCNGYDMWGMYGDATSPANEFGSQAGEAWAAGATGSASTIVGIIDSGVDYVHEDLAANMWTNPYEVAANGLDDDGNGYVDDVRGWDVWYGDNTPYKIGESSHGTHVAGTIGAVGGNGIDVVGVNWAVTMLPVKAMGPEGYAYVSGLTEATDYITGLKLLHPSLAIRVTSNSYGGPSFVQTQLDAINRGGNAGILFVAAAGNSAQNADSTPAYPAAYQCTTPTRNWDCIVSVAAITRTGALASFSNYGAASVDLGAPGVSIVSTYPGDGLAGASGTSMATPHVSGAVALCASISPSLTAEQIRTLLLGSVAATASLSGKTVTGGRLDASTLASRCVTHPVTVSKSGNGAGTVTSSPAGVSCGATCSARFLTGSSVTLTATPAIGSTFTGWGGDCTGTSTTCTVSVTGAVSATATFTLTSYTLAVTKSGSGSGTVSSSPSGLSCGTTCSRSFGAGTAVTLTATRAAGSVFAGWSGDCSGTQTTCSLVMNGPKSVTATFSLAATLTVTKSILNSGSGTVTSGPTGITCGSTCSAPFAIGSTVTLTGTPASGSILVGWSSNCAPVTATTCTVAIDAAKTVTATFQGVRTLTVGKTGLGAVTSNPAGIDCGATCAYTYPYNTSVVLTASPSSGYRFASWTNCPSPSSTTCTVATTSNRTITANFAQITYTLTVSRVSVGAGGGSVSSSPSGIACPSTCSKVYVTGTVVTLTAAPATGSVLVGWSANCAVTGALTCQVTMDASKSVTVTFATTRTLTVTKTNAGYGSVTSAPAGIDCGSTCSFAFVYNTSVTLTATPVPGRTFAGWSGSCTGASLTCTVTMSAARSVTATFA